MSLFNSQYDQFTFDLPEHYPFVLVEFYADWSGSCHIMTPVIKDLKNELNGELKICRVNFDTEKQIVNRFNVSKAPAFVIFKHGKMIEKIEGVIPRKTLVNKLKILIRNGKS